MIPEGKRRAPLLALHLCVCPCMCVCLSACLCAISSENIVQTLFCLPSISLNINDTDGILQRIWYEDQRVSTNEKTVRLYKTLYSFM